MNLICYTRMCYDLPVHASIGCCLLVVPHFPIQVIPKPTRFFLHSLFCCNYDSRIHATSSIPSFSCRHPALSFSCLHPVLSFSCRHPALSLSCHHQAACTLVFPGTVVQNLFTFRLSTFNVIASSYSLSFMSS